MLDGLFIGWACHEYALRQERDMASARASSIATEARNETDLLKADLARLLMVTEALWMILKEQHGYTEEDLIKRIQEIDMRDGKLDGKVAPAPQNTCPECGRVLIKNQLKCLYCGAEIPTNPFGR